MKDISILEGIICYSFKNKELLVESLTHKSMKKTSNNERLEYLGDAVVDLVLAEFLYHKFENAKEGELSKIRASIVNERSLANMAMKLSLGDFLVISTAEETNKGRQKPSLLADALEALIGAIYIESGFSTAKDVFSKILIDSYEKIDLESLFKDYKTILQELTQAKFNEIPEYIVIKEIGPDHRKEFLVSLVLCGHHYSEGSGASKKEAQQEAARIALKKLNNE